MSDVLKMYNEVGNQAFTNLVTQFAPYFSTIDPLFTNLKPGFGEVFMKKQTKIQNHLGTVHAIAMCNVAELVAGTVTDVSIPTTHRWIPTGMTVKYLAKAKTDLRAVVNGESVDWGKEGDVDVPVEVFDTEDKKVFTAVITMKVSPKP